ncbi:MAG: hypothetical protein FJZ47_07690 [Candidatus Tectomicrobia bacterium]|uniref:Uncharacterized protein n=1 Tax=Tectimicrobiota bacterium TaxID=2528274 RepID=A0A938B260_UNCTE|nr:hypothetical protein [Candidatus Tectomicrobia bacterium]
MKSIRHGTTTHVVWGAPLLVVLGILTSGCGQNALLFYEGTKVGFSAEYKPDSSQPLSTSLGYKRRIAAIVPPQEAASQQQQSASTPSGEALSLVSIFKVTAEGTGGLAITNHFASGMAAREMTSTPQATRALAALFAPATIREVEPSIQARREALAEPPAQLAAHDGQTRQASVSPACMGITAP